MKCTLCSPTVSGSYRIAVVRLSNNAVLEFIAYGEKSGVGLLQEAMCYHPIVIAKKL